MSAGMAEVIAAVEAIVLRETGQQVFRSGWDGSFTPAAGELVEELAKAGYGNVPAALLAAADEMPIETLSGADKAHVWLRHRAHSQDPEGGEQWQLS